uniref:Uncharacterized protein n=1 Tax=Clastoptera arizonana TaxID=38151 RepID=A0A1B6CUC2_9HEMI
MMKLLTIILVVCFTYVQSKSYSKEINDIGNNFYKEIYLKDYPNERMKENENDRSIEFKQNKIATLFKPDDDTEWSEEEIYSMPSDVNLPPSNRINLNTNGLNFVKRMTYVLHNDKPISGKYRKLYSFGLGK